FRPLLNTKKDGKVMQEFLEANNFEMTWIVDDESGVKINEKFEEFNSVARKLGKTKEKALFFVYYSGHGSIMDGMTDAHTTRDVRIPIEKQVRKLALFPNTFVISL